MEEPCRPAAPGWPVARLARVQRPPPGPSTRTRSWFPNSSRVLPGFPPEAVPVSGDECISTPWLRCCARAGGQLSKNILLSTERQRLSARECCYPPAYSQPVHRMLAGACPSAGWGWVRPGESAVSVRDNGRDRGAHPDERAMGARLPARPHLAGFAGVSRVARGRGSGTIRREHNKTRPPPFMGWRGPVTTSRTRKPAA
jgi:hypothetical protein